MISFERRKKSLLEEVNSNSNNTRNRVKDYIVYDDAKKLIVYAKKCVILQALFSLDDFALQAPRSESILAR